MELAVVMADGDTVLPEHITVNANASVSDLMNKERTLKEYELQIIQHYLDKYDKDVLLVAKKLDIGKSTIYRMIQAGELNAK
jgi:transcriptional regulator with PAS, ATPase and Fis domain